MCLAGYTSILVAYICVGSKIIKFLKSYDDEVIWAKNKIKILLFFFTVVVFLIFRILVYLDVYFFQNHSDPTFIYLRMLGTYSSEIMLTNFVIGISLKNLDEKDLDSENGDQIRLRSNTLINSIILKS